jgi:hypothetical protein
MELIVEAKLQNGPRIAALLADANELTAIIFSARRTTQHKS